ncbi:LLM class flavin-dependent oxidoreductase [Haloechinothrix salitolerans]|uniref:LLM class flavin-dependent oxidoreductase n=1 Tax=Haloechinothrix salitolerans TaxID=926830 RepID=A0ABW2BVF6_9PSEU
MLTVGVNVHENILSFGHEERSALLQRVSAGGLDHVCVADHVSFHGGAGFDGMVAAAAALAGADKLSVLIGIYQLALRHPMTVARQLSSLAQIGPGRIVFGVGAGGDDRSEVSNCGVDPATRGRRLNESLGILNALFTGNVVDHDGEFFRLDRAQILPEPTPRIPIVIGGSSPAAVRRTAASGDGWLAIFCSARRFTATVTDIKAEADRIGRDAPDWYGLNVWCGLDDDPGAARAVLADRMESLYRLPFEKFSRLAPAGTPDDVANFLLPYVEAGCRHFTLVAAATSWQRGIDHAAEVKSRLVKLSHG